MKMPKHPGQWWNEDDKFTAYYFCLRICYGMSALEAITTARQNFKDCPEFFADPVKILGIRMGRRQA